LNKLIVKSNESLSISRHTPNISKYFKCYEVGVYPYIVTMKAMIVKILIQSPIHLLNCKRKVNIFKPYRKLSNQSIEGYKNKNRMKKQISDISQHGKRVEDSDEEIDLRRIDDKRSSNTALPNNSKTTLQNNDDAERKNAELQMYGSSRQSTPK